VAELMLMPDVSSPVCVLRMMEVVGELVQPWCVALVE